MSCSSDTCKAGELLFQVPKGASMVLPTSWADPNGSPTDMTTATATANLFDDKGVVVGGFVFVHGISDASYTWAAAQDPPVAPVVDTLTGTLSSFTTAVLVPGVYYFDTKVTMPSGDVEYHHVNAAVEVVHTLSG